MRRFLSRLITRAGIVFSGLVKINRFLSIAAKATIGTMLAFNLSIVFAGVVFRYVLDRPLGWVYEVAIFLMMWSAFLGSAALTAEKGHVALEFLVLKFPPRLRNGVQLIIGLMILGFLGIIMNASFEMIAGLKLAKSAYLRLPMVWVYASVPVGMGMVMLQQVELSIKNLIGCFKAETS